MKLIVTHLSPDQDAICGVLIRTAQLIADIPEIVELDINPLLQRLRGRVGPIKYLRFVRDRKRVRTLIIYTVGIKRKHQHTRVYQLLLQAFCRMARDFDVLEATWVSPDNIPALRAAESLELRPDKHFGIFEKRLD